MSAPWPTLQVAPNVDRPPWGWNPVETYLTAYTTMQENQRAQEKAGMEAELSRILLPEKAAKAAFNIKQLAYESKLLEKSYNAQSADYDERMRVISGGGGGADADPTSNSNSTFKSQYGFGLGIKPQTAPAARPKVSWKIVTPVVPATPQTGP